MIIKDNVTIKGGIASKLYLTTDESGNINGSLSSGGGGGGGGEGGGGGGGGGATLVYNSRSMGKEEVNYIDNNYYVIDAGLITAGQTIDADGGQVPESWSSPFVINDPNLSNNKIYIVDNINVKIVNTSNSNEYFGTIVHGGDLRFNADNKIIYNFTDSSTTPYILDQTTTTYNLYILLYYIQPRVQGTIDNYNFNTNTGSYPRDNAIIITKGSQVETVNQEHFNIKLMIETYETDTPGTFKLFIMYSGGETPQIFSYPSICDDSGELFNITADTFATSYIENTGNYSTSTLVTNFPITRANISIISYI